MIKRTFYQEYDLRASAIFDQHPIGDSLTEHKRFMWWWDSLKPSDRKALEANIDARFKCLEEWKLQCPRSPSPTPPTPSSAAQLSATSASGQTLGLGGSQEPPSGSSNSPSKA